MEYNYSNVDDFMKAYKQDNIGFPYKTRTKEEIHEMFHKLQNYKVGTRIVHTNYTIRNVPISNDRMLFRDKYYIIQTLESDYNDWNILSDMFQEHCRMECTIMNNPSPLSVWLNNTREVATKCLELYNSITPHNLRETIYKMAKECTSHRPSNIMSMIQLFNSKSVLDISSGWGDRLIGAMASNVNYLGVDPNKCLHEGYNNIINEFKQYTDKHYQVLEGEFEKIDFHDLYNKKIIKNITFDLVYTSPPYFDLEIYTDKSPQSTSNYSEEDQWFNLFLKVALKNAWNLLQDNGVMAININQKRGENYVQRMIEYIDTLNGAIYLGCISYANTRLDNPQPIWCWKKNTKYSKYKQKYLNLKNS